MPPCVTRFPKRHVYTAIWWIFCHVKKIPPILPTRRSKSKHEIKTQRKPCQLIQLQKLTSLTKNSIFWSLLVTPIWRNIFIESDEQFSKSNREQPNSNTTRIISTTIDKSSNSTKMDAILAAKNLFNQHRIKRSGQTLLKRKWLLRNTEIDKNVHWTLQGKSMQRYWKRTRSSDSTHTEKVSKHNWQQS